jgi:hypothetical protein
VSLPQECSTAELVFYTWVARSRSGSSSFTASALNKLPSSSSSSSSSPTVPAAELPHPPHPWMLVNSGHNVQAFGQMLELANLPLRHTAIRLATRCFVHLW